MKIQSIIIECSADAEPDDIKTFSWYKGDELFAIECVIAKLQEFVDKEKSELAIALKAKHSLEINPS